MVNWLRRLGHHHLRDWLLQRLTAAVMVVYVVFWMAVLATQDIGSFITWRDIFSAWWARLLSSVFVASLLYHAWLGVRDVTMDYIQNTTWCAWVQKAVAIALYCYAVWTIFILWC